LLWLRLLGFFLEPLAQPLEMLSKKLQELQKSQDSLLTSIHHESEKFENLPFLPVIVECMNQTSMYEQKSVQLRKQMQTTSERLAKLKKRVEKLHLRKQQEVMAVAEKKERELERERQLTAKPSKALQTSTEQQQQSQQQPQQSQPQQQSPP